MTIWIWELKRWDKIKTIVTRRISEEDRATYESEEILTYQWMDWAYAKLYTSDGELTNAGGYVKRDWEYFIFCEKPDVR